MNINGIKEGYKKTFQFLNQKKVFTIITLILLVLILWTSASIRTNNISSLKDVTTGEYLTADLDAFYWLRLAEILDQNGTYPQYDVMRYPPLKLSFSNELLPSAITFLHKVLSHFSDVFTLRYVDVIYPVIFFVLSMIAFFFLILKLTKSKVVALLSSFFLAIIPAYLFRTMAGVSDHEPIGMFAFFLALLSFAISLEMMEKKKSWKLAIILGLIAGFFTTFNIAAWSGIAAFTLLIIPLTVFLLWITNDKNEEKTTNFKEYLLFYFFWMVSFVGLGFIFSYPAKSIIEFVMNPRGILLPLIFILMLVDYVLMNIKHKKLEEIGKYRIIVSLVISIVLIAIISLIFQQNIGFSISNLISNILRPFGGGRIGSTVAENALPYTVDIINQIGKVLFWLFFAGALIVGIDFSRGIGQKKNKILFSFLWILMICGIIFHRYTTSSIMNGESFISKFFYIGSIAAFGLAFIWMYFKDNIKTNSNNIIILLYTFFMALAGISAIRLLFILTPVVCFISAYALYKVYYYAKESKEEVIKVILYAALLGVIILLIFASITYIKASKGQSSQIGSSANVQWQYAMKWTRDNTSPGEIFVHWWDYGYWVQYMGERPTVTDGGHGNSYWDHLIGRYLLTTPNPASALSFMKAQNVSYLLIDPTDIGKYSAFSSIGSDASGQDRFSFIPTMNSDPSQIQETKNGTIRIYNGGYGLDGDIIYEEDGKKTFIPTQNSGIGGVIIEKRNNKFQQPMAAYFYNGNQINLPVRYIYYNGTLYDFKNGTNTAIYIIPQINQVGNGVQLDEEGALIYLSPKVVDSLIAQLYLMNDPLDKYQGVLLDHSEPDPIETYIETYTGIKDLNEFFYFNGLRGPLKIWDIDPPENIIALDGFSKTSGGYAELDNATFVK